jgi:hypothetical protein
MAYSNFLLMTQPEQQALFQSNTTETAAAWIPLSAAAINNAMVFSNQ